MQDMTHSEFDNLAASIAAELGKLRGETWTAGEGWHESSRRLHGPGAAELLVSYLMFHYEGRLSVHGSYPRTNASIGHGDISAAVSRGAAAVAKDISRRLLPAYLAKLGEVEKYNETEQAQYEARGELLSKAAALFGETREQAPYEAGTGHSHYRSELYLPHLAGVFGSVETYGDPDTVKLELHGVPAETALRMLAVLAEDIQP